MNDSSQRIDGPVGNIVAQCEAPSAAPAFVAIINHPHPEHGGSLHNKVVYTVARAVNRVDGVAVRYNFRGVGGSNGAFAGGAGEVEDMRAVVDWTDQRYPTLPRLYAGFSFGAYVALMYAAERPPAALLLVAPPVRNDGYAFTDYQPPSQTIVIQGGADDIVDPQAVIDWTRRHVRAHLLYYADAGHFFHGCLPLLRDGLIPLLRHIGLAATTTDK